MQTSFTTENYLEAHRALGNRLDIQSIEQAINLIKTTSEAGKKIITCGNGGSAYTASHYITDWNKMVNLYTGKQFRGFSLADNIGILTAFGNDLSYDDIFSGQLKAILDKGDLLIGISGSGNSPNVIKAVEYANETGAITLAIVGYDGGKLLPLAKHGVHIPSFDMQLCEDYHLIFGHLVMKSLCSVPIK